MRFLIDEDLPSMLAPALRIAGHDAVDGRDVGLTSHADAEVFSYAQRNLRAILTGDLDFANERRFPSGSHEGIIVARVPNEVPMRDLVAIIVRAISTLSDADVRGNLIIVEPASLRIRRPSAPS